MISNELLESEKKPATPVLRPSFETIKQAPTQPRLTPEPVNNRPGLSRTTTQSFLEDWTRDGLQTSSRSSLNSQFSIPSLTSSQPSAASPSNPFGLAPQPSGLSSSSSSCNLQVTSRSSGSKLSNSQKFAIYQDDQEEDDDENRVILPRRPSLSRQFSNAPSQPPVFPSQPQSQPQSRPAAFGEPSKKFGLSSMSAAQTFTEPEEQTRAIRYDEDETTMTKTVTNFGITEILDLQNTVDFTSGFKLAMKSQNDEDEDTEMRVLLNGNLTQLRPSHRYAPAPPPPSFEPTETIQFTESNTSFLEAIRANSNNETSNRQPLSIYNGEDDDDDMPAPPSSFTFRTTTALPPPSFKPTGVPQSSTFSAPFADQKSRGSFQPPAFAPQGLSVFTDDENGPSAFGSNFKAPSTAFAPPSSTSAFGGRRVPSQPGLSSFAVYNDDDEDDGENGKPSFSLPPRSGIQSSRPFAAPFSAPAPAPLDPFTEGHRSSLINSKRVQQYITSLPLFFQKPRRTLVDQVHSSLSALASSLLDVSILQEAAHQAQRCPGNDRDPEEIVSIWRLPHRSLVLPSGSGGVQAFQFLRLLGKGSSGSVVLTRLCDEQCPSSLPMEDETDDEKQEELFVVKIQADPVEWELYAHKISKERTADTRPGLVTDPIGCWIYKDFNVLLFPFDRSCVGTLQTLIQKSVHLDEILVVDLARQMIDMLMALHSADLVHGDLKPDNVLLQRDHVSGLLSLRLIDFARTIDLKMHVQGQQFVSERHSAHYMCLEMKKKLPWTFHIDVFGVCNMIHLLLAKNHLTVVQCSRTGWKTTKNKFEKGRLFPGWQSFFDRLLNASFDPSSSFHSLLLDTVQILSAFVSAHQPKLSEICHRLRFKSL